MELKKPSATFNLLGFITNVSLTANTHCMTDALTLACLAP